MRKTEFSREDEMPRLINPWRQISFPFPPCPSLPLGNRAGRLKESRSVAGRFTDQQGDAADVHRAVVNCLGGITHGGENAPPATECRVNEWEMNPSARSADSICNWPRGALLAAVDASDEKM